jgi:hypothetical protein
MNICGDCRHWMKSRECPRDDQRKGLPSRNTIACPKFKPDRYESPAIVIPFPIRKALP